MRTRVRTHEACRTWHTYVRTYVRTDVRRRAHFSAARIARAAPTSAAKPRNIPNNVRSYVPKAYVRACLKRGILRCRLADRLEDIGCAHGRAGAQKFANCQTLRTYQGQAWERSAPPRGVIGFDASPVPTLPLALDVRPLDAGSSGPPAPPVRIRNYITDEPLRLRPQALKQGTGALPPVAWAASPSG